MEYDLYFLVDYIPKNLVDLFFSNLSFHNRLHKNCIAEDLVILNMP